MASAKIHQLFMSSSRGLSLTCFLIRPQLLTHV
jgi:hypothetical protein